MSETDQEIMQQTPAASQQSEASEKPKPNPMPLLAIMAGLNIIFAALTLWQAGAPAEDGVTRLSREALALFVAGGAVGAVYLLLFAKKLKAAWQAGVVFAIVGLGQLIMQFVDGRRRTDSLWDWVVVALNVAVIAWVISYRKTYHERLAAARQ